MHFDITHGDRTTLAIDRAGALELGYPVAVVGAALKAAAIRAVEAVADGYRAQVSSASAGKLMAYKIKEELCRDTAAADPAELALFDRESTARGLTRDQHVTIVKKMASAFRQIALLIEVIEAEAKVAVNAIPDDASDIEAQVHAALEAANAQAESAFAEAMAALHDAA